MSFRITCVVLIFSHSLNGAFVASAGETTLEERLADMRAEAVRFMNGQPASVGRWTFARARILLLNLPAGSKLSVQCRDGRRVQGELKDVGPEEFALLVDVEQAAAEDPKLSGLRRGAKVTRRIRIEDVESIDFSGNGWIRGESLMDIEVGKNVEVLMLDGSRFRGRLKSRTTERFTLEHGGKLSDHPFDEVVMARQGGMKTSTAVWIGAGVALAVFFAVGLSIADDLSCGGCNLF
jgi:small nuclear ribonucleoprotein (snRNP)-like protein